MRFSRTPAHSPSSGDLQLGIYAGNGHESYDTASQAFVSDYQRPVSIPFSSMPCLHHFTLTAWDTFLEPLAEETTLPPLRSLALTHCWNIELNWFLDVYTRISSQYANRSSDGRAELSPKVTVIGCPWCISGKRCAGPPVPLRAWLMHRLQLSGWMTKGRPMSKSTRVDTVPTLRLTYKLAVAP